MAYRIHIDDRANCVFVQHYDTMSIYEAFEQVEQLVSNPNYVKGMNLLRDVTQTTLPSEYNLDWFRSHFNSRIQPVTQALGFNRNVAWVLGNSHDFKTIHQLCAITRLKNHIVDRRPFRDCNRAMKWLNLPEDYEITYPKVFPA
tara:strand:+ start:3026 stop:3457 length:432 start_codon:yes stop_codon:yes gene_type:complete